MEFDFSKKIKKEDIIYYPPTAQIRMLCCEILSDGKVHTRREVLGYVNKKIVEWDLGPMSAGAISGGFTDATVIMNCKKLGTGTYQAIIKNDVSKPSIYQQAYDICDSYIIQLTELSHTIEFVKATDDELHFLNMLRECINDVEKWKGTFNKKNE